MLHHRKARATDLCWTRNRNQKLILPTKFRILVNRIEKITC